MSKGYRKRRLKLKNHDAGHNRHNKGVAFLDKVIRKVQKKESGNK